MHVISHKHSSPCLYPPPLSSPLPHPLLSFPQIVFFPSPTLSIQLTGFSVLLTLTALGERSFFRCGDRTTLGISGEDSSCESSLKSALVG